MSEVDKVNHLQLELEKTRREIYNLRKQINTLQHIHQKEIDKISRTLNSFQCMECKSREENYNTSHALPAPKSHEEFSFKPIGVINSEFPRIRGTPRQPTITMNSTSATVTLNKNVFTNPAHALQDLDQFSHLWIIFVFHENTQHAKAKVSPPRLNGARTGLFATRSPHRPCPIGLSLVKIEMIDGNVIYFTGVDMVDGTPVLDIKPYIPLYDLPKNNLNNPIRSEVGDVVEEGPSRNFNTFLPTQRIPGTNVELVNQDSSTRIIEEPGNGTSSLIWNRNDCISESRGDPDGEENETDNSLAQNSASANVRIPSWIEESPVHKLTVIFTEEATSQLQELDPELAEERLKVIHNILQEDPRSTYLRKKWSGTFYIWRIANLCVSCKFNDIDHIVKVTKVFQNESLSTEI